VSTTAEIQDADLEEAFASSRKHAVEPCGEKRKAGFWVASGVALCLSMLSWIHPILIRGLNRHLFPASGETAPAEWLYLALRLPLSALLVWILVRLPVDAEERSAKPAARRSRAAHSRIFDPLMALRALACLLVFMGHFFLVSFPFTSEAYSPGVVTLLRSSPWGGVWVFFTLSGFLMGKGFAAGRYSLDGRGMRAFLRNRLIRIAPVYYGGLLLITIFRYPALLHGRDLWILLEACVFDFHGYLPIAALWSVSTEMQFYLLVPALALLLLSLRDRLGKGFLIVPALVLVIETALRMLLANRHGTLAGGIVYTPLLTNLDIFIAGMSISMLEVPEVRSERGRKMLNALLAAGILVLYVGISYLTQHRSLMHMSLESFFARCPVVCVLPTALYIYLAEMRGKIELRGGWVTRMLLLVQGMGTLTYCIYVFHSDVFLANAALLPAVHSLRVSLGQFPLAAVETLAVAGFFYFFLEKPFDRKKKVPRTPLADAP
jgi:peptidoglycan/LPS O-acetylase OafA/YrhL